MSNNISFTGYDARPLKGIFTRTNSYGESFSKLLDETAQILNKEGVDVFVQTNENEIKKDGFLKLKNLKDDFWPWVQDRIAFLQDHTIKAYKYLSGSPLKEKDDYIPGKIYFDNYNEEFFTRPVTLTHDYIPGGSYYFIKDENNKDTVLIGNKSVGQYSYYGVNNFFKNHQISCVTQPDYHIDLSIRPLNNRRILVNDPQMLSKEIDRAIKNALDEYNKSGDENIKVVIKNLKHIRKDIIKSNRQYETPDLYQELQRDLERNNFEIVKVPGVVIKPDHKIPANQKASYDDDIYYKLNFMNAIVHERPDKSLVYLTAKSFLDEQLGITQEIAEKIDFSFEKMFKKSLDGIIAPEDIHFVGDKTLTDTLKAYGGGLHCLFAEIPKD